MDFVKKLRKSTILSFYTLVFGTVNVISPVFASNSNSSSLDGFGGFIALFSIGVLAFMAPRLRRESLEEIN